MSEQLSAGRSEKEPCTFDEVFEAECKEILERRAFLGGWGNSGDVRRNLTGLALSGGGIRSATFCLGLLQGLRQNNLLHAFDYLSTVSGGGFVGGWWSAWLARDPRVEIADILDPGGLVDLLRKNDYLEPVSRGTDQFARYLMWMFEHPEDAAKSDAGPDETGVVSPAAKEASTTPGAKPQASLTAMIRNYTSADGSPQRDELLWRLLIELNNALELPNLYNERRCPAGKLSGRTRDLLDKKGQDRKIFNRLLLEDMLAPHLQRRDIFPPDEMIEPERKLSYLYVHQQEQRNALPMGKEEQAETMELREKIADGSLSAGSDPIHHLRLFANYLTPRKGALSADTWRAVSVVSRNLFLTWLILIPIFLAVVLMGQLYFLIHPTSAADFLHGGRSSRPAQVAPAPADTGDIPLYVMPGPSGAGDSTRADQERYRLYTRRQSPPPVAVDSAKLKSADQHSFKNRLINRAASGLWLLLPIVAWIVVLIIAWMICGQDGSSKRQQVIPLIELAAAGALIVCMTLIFKHGVGSGLEQVQKASIMDAVSWWWGHWYSLALWGIIAVLMLVSCCWTRIKPDGPGDAAERAALQWRREVRRNRLVRAHATLLVTVVILTAVLAIAGYSHELVDLLFNGPDGAFFTYLGRIGGWGGLLAAVGSAIFTALKAAPTGGGDKASSSSPSALSKVIFAVAPTLFVLAGAIAASWAGQALLSMIVIPASHFNRLSEPLHFATFIGVVLCFLFAWYEMRFTSKMASRGMLAICVLMSLIPFSAATLKLILEYFVHDPHPGRMVEYLLAPFRPSSTVAVLMVLLVLIVVVVRLRLHRVTDKLRMDREQRYTHHFILALGKKRIHMHPWMIVTLIGVIFAVVSGLTFAISGDDIGGIISYPSDQAPDLTAYSVFGLALCGIYMFWEIYFGSGANQRTLAVISANFVVLTVFIAIGFAPSYTHYIFHAGHGLTVFYGTSEYITDIHGAFCLMTTFLACAVVLGWTVDPNMLSIHTFYKARLTRAYMGASNQARRVQQTEINVAVEGDDLPLTSLRNCQRGGPYHLINTTLNLVAGRDLATTQRSAANFILTKNYCGSARTGYRSTEKYLAGGFTLGSAVSVSGAAASPNMGSKTPTSSLAMLMTMFNVRLGYWAPTPNKESWRSPQARLWPFYTLRELLSQTNDLSTYCYLTDGGHFENTALYALVERGCRYIVLADCGADPRPCFSDLGDAIRRCRIDFGIEIELNIIPVKVKADGDGGERYGTQHFVVGQLRYSKAHARTLGWEDCEEDEARTGYIIVVKPTLTQMESVDVRQYGFENSSFPQQSTADQWFDEAQFESYRRLGQLSVEQLLKSLKDGPDTLSDTLPFDPALGDHDEKLKGNLKNKRAISPTEIPTFFRGAFETLRVQENK